MGHNIGDLSAEERAAIAEQRRLSLEWHREAQRKEEVADKEYNRILAGRSAYRAGWRGWVMQQFDAIEDVEMRERVRQKINAFQASIAGLGFKE